MKISNSELQLASSHSSLQRHEISESLNMWVDNARQALNNTAAAPASKPLAELVSLSDAGKAAQAADTAGTTDATATEDPRLSLIRHMLELWLGRSIKVFDGTNWPQQLQHSAEATSQTAATGSAAAPAQQAQAPARAGFGAVYERRESYTEIEQTQFSASGTVKTADGREISFQLDLSMDRSYHEESNTSLRLGDAARKVDPLVLNFAGTAAQLTDQRFAFDLDADGKTEQINFVAPGSGFLVFDRNQDGRINDGSELFGPTTNDGFAELAALDDDGNGWIDENDAAFSQLQIWSRDADGTDRLQSLAEAGVGAIALSRVATPFDIKTTANDMLGQIRNSGIFLQENGTAGTIQQIDLTA